MQENGQKSASFSPWGTMAHPVGILAGIWLASVHQIKLFPLQSQGRKSLTSSASMWMRLRWKMKNLILQKSSKERLKVYRYIYFAVPNPPGFYLPSLIKKCCSYP